MKNTYNFKNGNVIVTEQDEIEQPQGAGIVAPYELDQPVQYRYGHARATLNGNPITMEEAQALIAINRLLCK